MEDMISWVSGSNAVFEDGTSTPNRTCRAINFGQPHIEDDCTSDTIATILSNLAERLTQALNKVDGSR
jgi:hypothetical protein